MSTTDTPQTDAPLLQLYTQVDEDGSGAPVLPVRWCVSPALIAELRERQFLRPHLVITVRSKVTAFLDDFDDEWQQTSMYIVPLRQELQFVSFSRPGENEIRVVVVDLAQPGTRQAVREKPVFDHFGYYRLSGSKVPYIHDTVTSLTVQVSRDMFAPAPRPWVERFVKNFFEDKPFDQCHFRRRKIVSFLLFAPLLLTIGIVVRVGAAMISLVLGRRDIPWKGLQPFNMNDISWAKGKSIWCTDKHGDADLNRFPTWFLNPITLGLLPPLTYVVMNHLVTVHHGDSTDEFPLISISWAHAYEYVDSALVALVVAIALIVGLVWVGAALYTLVFGNETAISRRRKTRRDREELHRQHELQRAKQIYAALEGMTCSQASSNATLSALPKKKQTVFLLYNRFKATVCKPYAR